MKTFRQINEGLYDPSIFKVVFLSGGPGSGKTFVSKKVALKSMGFRTINIDDAIEYLLKKNNLSLLLPKSEKDKRDVVVKRADNIRDEKLETSIRNRLGLLIDGTGRNYEKIKVLKDRLEKIGYESSIILINTDDDTSKKRNIKRGLTGGRKVPEDFRKKAYDEVQKNIGKFQMEFKNNFYIIDNSDDSDIEKQTQSVYKKIQNWASKPPSNNKYKEWYKLELQKRKRN